MLALRTIVFSFLAFLALAIPALAQELLRSDLPDWVQKADRAEMPPELYRHVLDGQAFHMVDRQIRWHEGRKETYVRIAVEAANRSGLEAVATVSRDFDPAIETLTMVQLDVIRDGVATSLKGQVDADIFRRESNLESGIIDGTLTAFIQVPGIRVGDIIDAAFIWSSAPYFEGANLSGRMSLEYGVPVGSTRAILNWPADQPLSVLPQTGLGDLTETTLGDTRKLVWTYPATAPRQFDEDAPPEFDPYAVAAYSGLQSWGDIVDALSSYYDTPHDVPEAWASRVEALATQYDSDEDRAYAALRLVQDEIRYVGIEVGAGGYFARSPEKVVTDQFGDCKDKAVLLKTVLRALGLEATVALANLDYGYGLPQLLPGAGAFDHMITGVKLGEEWVWMDPTATHEGGRLASSLEPDYGYVLPLTPGTNDLVRIASADRPRYVQSVVETYTFTPLGMILAVETVKRGDSANRERAYWATTPIDDIKRRFTEFYARAYPGITTSVDPVHEDDRDDNAFVIREFYLLPRTALLDPNLQQDFPFRAQQPFSFIPEVMIGKRQAPLWMPHKIDYQHEIRVRNAPIEFRAPEAYTKANSAFDFRFKGEAWDGGNMDLHWEFTSQARSIEPDHVPEIVEDAREARDYQSIWWDLTPDEEG